MYIYNYYYYKYKQMYFNHQDTGYAMYTSTGTIKCTSIFQHLLQIIKKMYKIPLIMLLMSVIYIS